MTDFAKSSVNIVLVIGALVFTGGSGWGVAAYLGGISAQIEASKNASLQESELLSNKIDRTDDKVAAIQDGQNQTHDWIKNISSKVDQNTELLQKHDIALARQSDQIDEIKRAVDKDAAANRAQDARARDAK